MEESEDDQLATGAHVDRILMATDLKVFSTPCQTLRRDITCFRCGEDGHWKHECLQWRTRPCWHYAHGTCTRKDCPFAHGDAELRTPWTLKCVRIIKSDNALHNIGCGSFHHSFRNCPHRVS